MIPELLAPAGDMDCAKAAISAGADAVYLGGKSFSARSAAQNFSDVEIESLIDYAALRGVRVYIAVNTLYSNSELSQVFDFVKDMYRAGASAFILQDIGLAKLLKGSFPDIELHASTQMTIHSVEGAKYLAKAGFSRAILSRELSLAEISEINKEAGIETEVFAHGALCLSYSGQCLMSSLIGGRSGNRGKCAQPCRLAYDLLKNNEPIKSGYLLSPKDMMTLDLLDDVVSTGVSALKIEGRMKNPEYVYIVTNAYREKLDGKKPKIKDVTQIFNRGGEFSTGYYKTHGGLSMMSVETPKSTGVFCGIVTKYEKGKCTIRFAENMLAGDGIEIWTNKGAHVGTGINRVINKNDLATMHIEGNIEVGNAVYKSYDKRLIDETKRLRMIDTKKTQITGEVIAKINEPIKLVFKNDSVTVEVYSKNVIEKAKNAPMDKAAILAQLSKTGNVPFEIHFNNANIDDGIFVSKSVLNEVRRDAIAALEKAMIQAIKRNSPEDGFKFLPKSHNDLETSQEITVQITDIAHLDIILNHEISRVYVNFNENNLNILSKMESCPAEIFIALPHISRNETDEVIKNWVEKLENANFDGYLAATYGQLNMLQGTKKKIALDYHFNIFNNHSANAFENVDGITISQELNAVQIKRINAPNTEIIIHGRQILMSTHNCPIGLYDAQKEGKFCSKRFHDDKYALLDRKDVQFPVVTDCENCIAYVLNSKTLDTAARFSEIKSTGAKNLRIVFRDETVEDISDTIAMYKNLLNGNYYEADSQSETTDRTYGHFFRGVE